METTECNLGSIPVPVSYTHLDVYKRQPTGFMDLDYKTSGMHPSDLVLIAARPSMGKTAFVLNIAQYMACLLYTSPWLFTRQQD